MPDDRRNEEMDRIRAEIDGRAEGLRRRRPSRDDGRRLEAAQDGVASEALEVPADGVAVAGRGRVVLVPPAFVVFVVFVVFRLVAGFRAVVFAVADSGAASLFEAAALAAGLRPALVADRGLAAGLRGLFGTAGVDATGVCAAAGDAAPAPAVAVVDADFADVRLVARVARVAVAVFRVVALGAFARDAREAAVFAPVVRRRVGLRVRAILSGVTASAAWTAAATTPFAAPPTPFAAPPIASPTVLAAEPADEVASDAIRLASEATSDAASSARWRRLAITLAPRGAWAAASWRSRFDSVLRAASRRFSSLRSSFVAAFGSGVTAPFASTTTPETVSTTISVRVLFRADPSPPLAIERPPLWGRTGRDGPSPSESLPRSASLPATVARERAPFR
jgi:hypothetical protein